MGICALHEQVTVASLETYFGVVFSCFDTA